jgi:alpha-tubulin suppressor-like RCC1 family protein
VERVAAVGTSSYFISSIHSSFFFIDIEDQGEVWDWGNHYWGQLGLGNIKEDQVIEPQKTSLSHVIVAQSGGQSWSTFFRAPRSN